MLCVYPQKMQEVDHLFNGASFSFSRKDAFPSDIKSSKKIKINQKKRGNFFYLFEEL